jgi:putative nucleotidyltransferase with HDIG domain
MTLNLPKPLKGNPRMDREQAYQIVREHVTQENLIHHMLAVEAAMRDYAVRLGEDPELWGMAGLLHDYDWEIHPTLKSHPQDGVPLLRQRGVPEVVITCILSHADHTGVPRQTPMEKGLFACDELTGLITAVALVRPSKSLYDVKLKSVRKKWKDARFAAGVDRAEVEEAVRDFGVPLNEHIQHVLESMKRIAPDLGLAGDGGESRS